MEKQTSPSFTIDEGAQPSTLDRYARLTEYINAEPAPGQTFALLNSYPKPDDLINAANHLKPEDITFNAGVLRALAQILADGNDLEVGYDETTESKIWATRNLKDSTGARLLRLGVFVSRFAQNDNPGQKQAA